MEVHARISKEWRRRMLFMFFMLFVIGAWFLTDGYIIWPKEAERHSEYTRIVDELVDSGQAEDEESRAVELAWERFAAAQGFRDSIPSERTKAAIREQRIIGWIMMTGTIIFALWITWNHKRSVQVKGEVITGASGEQVEFDSIIGMDRKKWKSKGIAYAIYEEGGKQRRLTLDDHKFMGCEAIILEAEKRIKARREEAEPIEEADPKED